MIRAKKPINEIVVDLDGPQGNAYEIMGLASRLAIKFGEDGEDIIREMMQGDYTHLLKTFEKFFGFCVVFETESQELIKALEEYEEI